MTKFTLAMGGLLLVTSTATIAAPTMQQKLDSLERKLDQQQRMIEQQQQMMQQMMHELKAQKVVNTQRASDDQKIKKIAERAEKNTRKIAEVEKINLSKITDQFGDSKGLNVRVPETDTVLTISGFIRASAIHDFDNISSPTKFVTKDIVVQGSPSGQPDSQTTFTANASRFVLGTTTPTKVGKLTTFFSWDFAGNTTSADPDMRLRQAWGQLDGFILGGDLLVGQAWTAWDDLEALPETMDFQGPNGSQQNRQPLVKWSRDYGDDYTLQVSLEDPKYSITNGGTESAWPDTIVTLNWHGDWGHLKPAFIGRNIKGDATNGGSDSVFGWGAQLAGVINTPLFAKKDNLKFQMVYGSGIGSYNNDGGFDDAIFNAKGDLKAIDSAQGFGAYQHWWTSDLRTNLVFGVVDVDNRKEQTEDSLDRTLYTAANLVWSPVKQVDFGVEYLWGERRNKNDKKGTANRIMTTAKYKF